MVIIFLVIPADRERVDDVPGAIPVRITVRFVDLFLCTPATWTGALTLLPCPAGDLAGVVIRDVVFSADWSYNR